VLTFDVTLLRALMNNYIVEVVNVYCFDFITCFEFGFGLLCCVDFDSDLIWSWAPCRFGLADFGKSLYKFSRFEKTYLILDWDSPHEI